MMNLAGATGRRTFPVQRAGEQVSLGAFATYAEAQSMVDYLADHHFEVETTQIIGSDLRMVEQITGRLNWPRAVLSGMARGAWFGVFVGLLLSVLTTTTFLRAMVLGLVWGVLFGGAFAAVGYGLSGGRRDFISSSATVPGRFEVLVDAAYNDHARTVLAAGGR